MMDACLIAGSIKLRLALIVIAALQGDTLDVVAPLAAELASRCGLRVVALELRGHGGSTPSASGQYAPAPLARDVESFLTEKDLYVRPLAVIGFGIGAAVALALADKAPQLVGALALVDYVPDAAPLALAFVPLQAAAFGGMQDAAAALAAPVWPGQAPRRLAAVVRHLAARLQPPNESSAAGTVWGRGGGGGGPVGAWRLRMDPRWCFTHDAGPQRTALGRLACPLLLLRGTQSHVVVSERVKTGGRGRGGILRSGRGAWSGRHCLRCLSGPVLSRLKTHGCDRPGDPCIPGGRIHASIANPPSYSGSVALSRPTAPGRRPPPPTPARRVAARCLAPQPPPRPPLQ